MQFKLADYFGRNGFANLPPLDFTVPTKHCHDFRIWTENCDFVSPTRRRLSIGTQLLLCFCCCTSFIWLSLRNWKGVFMTQRLHKIEKRLRFQRNEVAVENVCWNVQHGYRRCLLYVIRCHFKIVFNQRCTTWVDSHDFCTFF